MIILPERGVPRGKLLLPMRAGEWRQPSQRSGRYNIENRTRWRLTARLNDGHVAWRGWFDDREDADAFLLALACGSLGYERALWDLPAPAWRPDILEHLSYDFATVTFLTASPGTPQTYSTPVDWNNSSNKIEAVGAGGGGGGILGAGGGAYAAVTNLTLAGDVDYSIGDGGPGGAGSTPSPQNPGTTGGDTWFNAASFAASSVGAKGGAGSDTINASLGGSAASSIGTTKFSGGDGPDSLGRGGTGGGGAAGANGDGNDGATSAADAGNGGGGGDAGIGGAGGAAGNPGSPGGAGSEWDGTHGSGGGGGGGNGGGSVHGNGGDGGAYGGAGAGGGFANALSQIGAGGDGYQGIVVVTYTPASSIFIDNSSTSVFCLP